jgi:hypothetical protein
MNKIVPVAIFVSCVVSFVPLYYFILDYTSYLYWINETDYYKCSPHENCPVDTPSICKNAYENHNYASFHDVCTIHRFDGDYGTVQFTSIVMGMIPVMISVSLLSVIYVRHRTEIKK